MNNRHLLFGLFGLMLFTSCSFNKMFLQPDVIPSHVRRMVMKTETDSIIIFLTGDSHAPTFLKNGTEPMNSDYTIESVTFKSKDGSNINGWMLKPKNAIPSITLLHLHGNAGNLFYQYHGMTPLLKEGFQIFMFDYSGFGFSDGKATRDNVFIDAQSALDYVKSRDDVQNTKLVIYGQSLGGHLAAVVASLRQNDIDGLVVEGAFSSHKDIAAHQVPVLGRLLVKQGYQATRSIKDFHKPILVIHSTEDDVVPFYMGKRIFDSANEPKEFYEIKKCHICGPIYYAGEISTKIHKMLKVP